MRAKAKIVEHVNVGPGYYLLGMLAPEIAAKAEAGQFIHIRCIETRDPLLRRPFSFYSIDPGSGIIKILYEVRGIGTRLLSRYPEGEALDILGPLGNGFKVSGPYVKAILVGGGIGGAPMFALAQKLRYHGVKEIKLLLGAPTKDKILPRDDFYSLGAEVEIATDDGSAGHHGPVTDLLPPAIEQAGNSDCTVFACGPDRMLRAVAEICSYRQVSCQLSMDAFMGCGVGACQSCACKIRDDKNEVCYARVCIEGPVFDSREVVWDD